MYITIERLIDESLEDLMYEKHNILGLQSLHAYLNCGRLDVDANQRAVIVFLQQDAVLPYSGGVGVLK